jgi:hypothetical protein
VTSQLTNIESSLKSKIDNVNIRIDSISTAFSTLKTQVNINSTNITNAIKSISDITTSITELTKEIKTINTSITNTNTDLKNKTETLLLSIDSSFKRIFTIDSTLKKTNTNTDTINTKVVSLNTDYNNILSKYLDLLKLLKTQPLTITGKIEKGPFSKGSIISFYELDSNLSQTGKSYSTTINDNEGNYELKVGSTNGNMVRVQTDGFYYNEILNGLSTSRIVMTGISKLDSTEKININVLTHLERRRVEYLMGTSGLSYDAAKKQSVSELLKTFNITDPTITRSEKVSLFSDNKDILLNLSLLFLGYRTDAQLSELLTDFSNDFYKDGTIETVDIKKRIYNHSYFIDSVAVKSNIKTKFNISTKSFSILKDYLTNNSSSKDESYMPIIYPDRFNGKKNALVRIPNETISKDTQFCFYYQKNDIPTFDYKVIVKSTKKPGGGLGGGSNIWFYSNNGGWNVSNFDFDNFGNQTFYSQNPIGEISISFGVGEYDLYFYEPSSSPSPTFIKHLIVQ